MWNQKIFNFSMDYGVVNIPIAEWLNGLDGEVVDVKMQYIEPTILIVLAKTRTGAQAILNKTKKSEE